MLLVWGAHEPLVLTSHPLGGLQGTRAEWSLDLLDSKIDLGGKNFEVLSSKQRV